MRNLKRALSLALASIMLLGMMVVGAGAKGLDDFSDAAEITNKDAVAVTSAIGIFDGYETGDFRPERVVTRGEMAVIISKILYGANVDVSQFAGQSTFTDVPAWAEGYVNLCASLGIVAGYGDGKFGTNDTVTTAQAALMLCRAVGYFQNESELGDSWVLAATAKANGLGIYNGLSGLTATEGLNRDNVAGMVFNTLTKAATVEYNPTFNMYYTTGADFSNGTKFSYRETLGYKNFSLVYMSADADSFGRPSTVWGTGVLGRNDIDADGNIISTYSGISDRNVVIEAVNEARATWTSGVSYKALYDATGSGLVSEHNYHWTIYVDGEKILDGSRGNPGAAYNDASAFLKTLREEKNSTEGFLKNLVDDKGEKVHGAGNGVLTTVYVDDDDITTTIDASGRSVTHEGTVIISVIHSYAAEIYTAKDNVITLVDLSAYGPATTKDEFTTKESYKENDVVYYTFSESSNKIESVNRAEALEGQVSRVRMANSNPSDKGNYFVVDSKQYNYNETMNMTYSLNTGNVNNNVLAYLDSYGYCVYVDESAINYDYAYVLSVTALKDNYGGDGFTYNARLILTDGTLVKSEIEVDGFKIADYLTAKAAATYTEEQASDAMFNCIGNSFVTYSKDSNNVYQLKPASDNNVNGKGEVDIDSGKAGMTLGGKSVTANANTVFILADDNGSPNNYNDWSFSIYKGIKNVPDVTGKNVQVAAAYRKNNSSAAEAVFVLNGEVSSNGTTIFIRADRDAKLVKDDKIGNWYEMNAVVDGETTTLRIKETGRAAELLHPDNFNSVKGLRLSETKTIVAVQGLTYDSNDLVTSVSLVKNFTESDKQDTGWAINETGTCRTTKQTIGIGNNGKNEADAWYGYSDNIAVVRYNLKNNNFTLGTVGSIKDDTNDVVLYVRDKNTLIGVCIVEDAKGKLYETPVTYGLTVTDKEEVGYTIKVDGTTVTDVTKVVVKSGTEIEVTLTGEGSAIATNATVKNTGKVYTFTADGKGDVAVTISKTQQTPDGTKLDTELTGSSATTSYSVASNGKLNLTVNYTAPEYAAENTNVTFDLDVYANGAYYDTLEAGGTATSFMGAAGKVALGDDGTAVITYRSATGAFPANEPLTFKIVKNTEKLDAVKVQYLDGDTTKDITGRLAAGYTSSVNVAAGQSIGFTVANVTTGNSLQRSVEGLTEATAVAKAAFATNDAAAQSIGSLEPTGKSYVVVRIYGLSNYAEKYNLTAAGALSNLIGASPSGVALSTFDTTNAVLASADNAVVLKLTTAKNTGLGANENVVLKAALGGSVSGAGSYDLEITIAGVKYEVKGLKDTTGVDLPLFKLTSNYEIQTADIKIVKANPAFGVQSVSWEGNQVTVTFNEAVAANGATAKALSTYTWTGDGTATAATKAKYSIQISAVSGLSDGDTFTLDGKSFAVKDDGSGNITSTDATDKTKMATAIANLLSSNTDYNISASGDTLVYEAKVAGAFGSTGAPTAAPTAPTVASLGVGKTLSFAAADLITAGTDAGTTPATPVNASRVEINGNTVTVIFTGELKVGHVFNIATGVESDADNTVKAAASAWNLAAAGAAEKQ